VCPSTQYNLVISIARHTHTHIHTGQLVLKDGVVELCVEFLRKAVPVGAIRLVAYCGIKS
jgi:hypothetical protein